MKKLRKKLLAVLLAATMIMAMGVTSFAKTTSATIPVSFYLDATIESDDYADAVALGYNATTADNIRNLSLANRTKTVSASNGLAAITTAGNQILANTVVTGTTTGGDTTIEKVFTLPTINKYTSNSWKGYYWMVIVNGVDENDEDVSFESSEYPADIPLGTEHTFNNIWDNENQSYSSITCTVTSLEVHYVTAYYTW